jgi:phospholipase C
VTAASLAIGLAMVAAVLSPGATKSPAVAATPGTPQTPIEHIVFVMKENRSFDHYFGRLLPARSGGGGLPTNGAGDPVYRCYRKSDPTIVDVKPMPPTSYDPMPQDVAHANSTFVTAYHGGKMDGFCHEKGAIVASTGKDIADTAMAPSQIPNYFAYARKYGLGDRMFASWRGASFANNVFEVAGQTGRYWQATGWNRLAVVGNPRTPESGPTYSWGCDTSLGTTVETWALDYSVFNKYPCLDFPTITDRLEEHGLSWKVYADRGKTSYVHVGLNAFRSVACASGGSPPCVGDPIWKAHNPGQAAFVKDAAAGNLPAVSWFQHSETEHPPKTACRGENSTVAAANAVMSGPDWNSTAIVLVHDEWGGYYDHVKPPTASGFHSKIAYGFRVPLLVISPWTKVGTLANGGYVSTKFYSHASLLRFVESAFALPSLGAMDDLANYTAGEPKPGDLMDFFDFSDPTTPPKGKLLLTTRSCPTLSAAQKAYIATWDPD